MRCLLYIQVQESIQVEQIIGVVTLFLYISVPFRTYCIYGWILRGYQSIVDLWPRTYVKQMTKYEKKKTCFYAQISYTACN